MEAPSAAPTRFEMATKFSYDEDLKDWKSTRIAVEIELAPFARGASRLCYMMRVRDKDGKEEKMVAKIFMKRKRPEDYFKVAMTQHLAQEFAEEFNNVSTQKISFAQVFVVKLHERSDALVCAEPVLQGHYIKHLNNAGKVFTSDTLAQAFTHFTWKASGRRIMICDIQGVGDVYTDPSIQCEQEETPELAEKSCNWGGEAVHTFFRQHRCSVHCRSHALQSAQEELLSLQANRSLPLPCAYIDELTGKRRVWHKKKAFHNALVAALHVHAQLDNTAEIISPHHE